MAILQIADKPTLDVVDSDVTYIKNNLPSGGSSPILVIKNDNMDFTGIEFTISCGDFTDTVTMPDDDSVEIEVPYIGEYSISYSDDLSITDIINISSVGKTLFIPSLISIPSFANATWEQIDKVVTAYYNGEISDLSTYWSIGDTKIMHLNDMQAPNPISSYTWAAQDITVVIVAFNHTDLATPINGHTKAAITMQTRETISSSGTSQGTIYINGDSSNDTSFTKWSNLYMRTYLNDKVWGAFPTTFKSAIKPSKHYRHTNYNTTDAEQVTDNLFLPSYPEIYGKDSYNYYKITSPVEGSQFPYYKTASNRIKYNNNNGASGGVAQNYWMGSASSAYNYSSGYRWCGVNTSGSANNIYGAYASGLAPAFAM